MSNELKKIVEWFLSQQSMSPKKLQKMLYYAQAWCVTLSNETSEEIEINYLMINLKLGYTGLLFQKFIKHIRSMAIITSLNR